MSLRRLFPLSAVPRASVRRWRLGVSLMISSLGTIITAGAFPAPASASVEFYASISFKYGDGKQIYYGGIPGLTNAQHYDLQSIGGFAVADANDKGGGLASVDVATIGAGIVPLSQIITEVHATTIVTYRFTLSGPDTGKTVPVLLRGAGASTGGLDALSIQDGFGSGFYAQGNFNTEQVLNLVPGWGYTMALYASADAYNGFVLSPGETNERGASVDPTLTIQGDDAQLYHFEGLPTSTIGNVAAVPEPASWALMLSGFGLIGGAIRRRRAAVSFA